MKKDKALKIAESVLEQVGGKQNIAKVLHCQTRLRFNLKDESIANHEKIEAVQGVLGVVRAGGQVQIVIGPEVKDVYNELCELGDFDNTDREPVSAAKEKITLKSIGNGILDAISGSMGPAIPAIVASAFFKMLTAILGPELLNVIGEGNDLYTLFTFVGDAAFYFFPVIVGYTSAKKFNLNPVMGILMGAILIHPTFVGLVGKPFTVYGIPCNVQSYASSIVPIILSNWVMSYIAKFFDRIVPGAIRSVFAPALTIAAMLPIALCVFGPAGAFIGQYVVDALFSLEGIAGFIGIGLIAALYPVLVMTGMHMVLITTLFQIFATYGSDGFAAVAVSVSSFSIMGVGIGAFFRLKNKEQKALAPVLWDNRHRRRDLGADDLRYLHKIQKAIYRTFGRWFLRWSICRFNRCCRCDTGTILQCICSIMLFRRLSGKCNQRYHRMCNRFYINRFIRLLFRI